MGYSCYTAATRRNANMTEKEKHVPLQWLETLTHAALTHLSILTTFGRHQKSV